MTRRNAPRNADFTIKCSKNQQFQAMEACKTMGSDPRDVIWTETYQLKYQVSYTAEIEQTLLARWIRLDSITRVTLAVTSAGSALAGLIFWDANAFAFLWPLLTSSSALLAIISKQLNVVERVKLHTASVSTLTALTVDTATLMVRMRINARFPVALFERRLLALRERYRTELQNADSDLLLTRGVRRRAQDKVDREFNSASKLGGSNDQR
ncbi:hypothetical protein GTP23_15465 [Pseudoduganella sp. FT93W]|uniref:SLATT domain-containing protein n=1 Tax=Duganella fentianensis TaxID=2692177 RepID=A0A845I5N4_9BURK|nr:hypothetical protein [Duganella fentianensis]MYN46448.1 hypothetical protein [Duganella fentianensis]